MVKGVVELHGGTVRAESDGPGYGARFTVSLPLAESCAESKGAGDEAAARATGRSLLVIEDNRDAADSLADVLQFNGHRVSVAYSGAEGLEKAKQERPEVVLCDIGLPGMDGYAVARTMRQDPALASIHLIALTGYAQPEDQRAALHAGFDAHLAKPPDLARLERMIQEAR